MGISINARSDIVSGRYFGSVLCSEGFNDCEDSVRTVGKTWIPLEKFARIDEFIHSGDNEVVFRRDILSEMVSQAIRFFGAHLNREDIKRGLMLSNDDDSASSYVLTLMNTIIKPVTASYYLSLLYWISIDGDWWGNPNAAFSALIIGFVPSGIFDQIIAYS